jgi:tetratricopeptide (TPR) repeat protein
VSAELVGALGSQRGKRLAERLGQASEALDRERYQEARRIAASIAKEAPSVAAAHEILGLADYRLGMFKAAAAALETAQDLHPDPALLPVIADCYRALRNWRSVDEVWRRLREASPNHEVMAEGRIVAAGALADQGDLRGAIATMEPATRRQRSVRAHHLRQWYVLGDLYDRVGDPIAARRWFTVVAEHDPDFVDVGDRLRSLGR